VLVVAVDPDLRVIATSSTGAGPLCVPLDTGDHLPAVLTDCGLPHVARALEREAAPADPGSRAWQRIRVPHDVDGDPRHLTFGVLGVDEASGRVLGVLLTVTDTTATVRAEARSEVTHEAARIIGTSLDVAETARQLADLLAPRLADLAAVHLAEAILTGDEPTFYSRSGYTREVRAAVAQAGDAWPSVLIQVGERAPVPPDVADVRAMQDGATLLIPHLGPDAGTADIVPDGAHSLLAVPLFARGQVLGSVQLWRTDQPEPFDEEDARLVEEIASRAALSVDNARRYTRERKVVLALQRSLLPEAGPDEPAAETFGLYLPTSSPADVGGDWYDKIPLSSMRLALVVGEVAGHGLQATATMGRVRTAVQALADMDLPPEELLAHVDDLVQRFPMPPTEDAESRPGVTCLYVEYDPVDRRCRMASAGHPPPAIVTPDGHARFVDLEIGLPLGVDGMPFATMEIVLEAGSVLVLYSDGLISGAEHGQGAGSADLIARLESLDAVNGNLESIGRELVDTAGGRSPEDDTTLLLARVRALPDEDSVLWELPCDPAYVGPAREMTIAQLDTWNLEHLAFTTELIVSELVTNAVRYGGHGPITLRLIRGRDVLICEVSDPSNTQPRLRRALATDEGGRGLFLVAQLTERWGSRYQQYGKTIWTEQPIAGGPPAWDLGFDDPLDDTDDKPEPDLVGG